MKIANVPLPQAGLRGSAGPETRHSRQGMR
jgi:hypothetical protein